MEYKMVASVTTIRNLDLLFAIGLQGYNFFNFEVGITTAVHIPS